MGYNSDLQEETLSGRGTTHCTSGIVLQTRRQETGLSQSSTNARNTKSDGAVNNCRRSIKPEPNAVIPYQSVPRKGDQLEKLVVDQDLLTASSSENAVARKMILLGS